MSLENTNDTNPTPADEVDAISQEETGPVPPRVAPPAGLVHKGVPTMENPEGVDPDAELEEFDNLIDSYIGGIAQHEMESIISVPVVDVRSDHVLVDLGDKAEGIIDLQEFMDSKGNVSVSAGDKIDVMVLGRDEDTGLIQVSFRDARGQVARKKVEQAATSGAPVTGVVQRVVKSGLIVDMGMPCFMPASQIADHRVDNLEEWVGKEVDALVVDFDPRKNRAVLSRRKLIEKNKKKALEEVLAKLKVGDIVEGKVRSVLNFGAFIELSGIDAFLPRDEISYDKGVAPASVIAPGAEVRVKVMQIDKETGRVSVSRKALHADPWQTAAEKYPEGTLVRGEVVSIASYGAFVHIEEGLTGLVHVSDLSWGKGQQKVGDYLKEGDSIEAAVLSVDPVKRRLSLGLKQMVEDPWTEAEKSLPRNAKIKGTVTSLTTFGAFVKLTDEIEGLIHISDFSWDENVKHPGEVLKVGDEVEAVVLKTDRQTRRISLGIKQLTQSPKEQFLKDHPVGSTVEGEVVRMIPTGAFLSLAPQIDGFLHVSQIAMERINKPEDVLKVGDKVECKITKIERPSGKIALSRKTLMAAQEAEDIRRFKAQPSEKGGMNLGELLKGIVIKKSE